jgi:hypothetical protein
LDGRHLVAIERDILQQQAEGVGGRLQGHDVGPAFGRPDRVRAHIRPDVDEEVAAAQNLPPDEHFGQVGRVSVQDLRGSGPVQVDPEPGMLAEPGHHSVAQQSRPSLITSQPE